MNFLSILVVLINTSLFFICFLLYMGDQIPTSLDLCGGSELGDGLGSLRDGMLGKLSR